MLRAAARISGGGLIVRFSSPAYFITEPWATAAASPSIGKRGTPQTQAPTQVITEETENPSTRRTHGSNRHRNPSHKLRQETEGRRPFAHRRQRPRAAGGRDQGAQYLNPLVRPTPPPPQSSPPGSKPISPRASPSWPSLPHTSAACALPTPSNASTRNSNAALASSPFSQTKPPSSASSPLSSRKFPTIGSPPILTST